MSHRTIQDEQARLRKKRRKAESFFAIFKKPLHKSLTSVLPVMLIVMLILVGPALRKGRLSRVQGIALLAIYAAFCVVQFML